MGKIEELDDSGDLPESEQCKALGNAAFRKGDYEDAQKHYLEAVELCSEDRKDLKSIYYGNLSAAQLKLKKYEDTIESCNSALELDPKYVKVRLRRAQANEMVGSRKSVESAITDLQKCQEDDASLNAELQKKIETLKVRLQVLQKKETDELIEQAKGLGNTLLGKFGMSLDNFKSDGKGGYTFSK